MSECPHGVPYRWNCETCDAAPPASPAESMADRQDKERAQTGESQRPAVSAPTQPGDAVALLMRAAVQLKRMAQQCGTSAECNTIASDIQAHLSSAKSAGAQEPRFRGLTPKEAIAAVKADQRGDPVSVERNILKSAYIWLRGALDCKGFIWDSDQHDAATEVCDALNDVLYAAASAKAQWQPIETAPKDNKIPLLLARFNDDGSLQSIDYNGIWESDRESWEIPERYWYWASAHGNVEEPSHWMYQPEWYAHLPAAASERGGSDER